MSDADALWVSSVIGMFLFGSILIFIYLHHDHNVKRREQLASEPLLSMEVREQCHSLRNEVTKFGIVTTMLSNTDDPIKALVMAMTGDRYERRY